MLAGHREREADRGALDHPLILVSHVAPELFVVRVRPVRESSHPPFYTGVGATTGEQGGETPYGAREALELGSGFVVVCPSKAEVDTGTSGRSVWGERIEEGDQVLSEFGLGLNRVGRERRGVCKGGHGDVVEVGQPVQSPPLCAT